MRRVQLIVLAAVLTTVGGLLAACGSSVADTSGSGGGAGGTGGATTTATTATTGGIVDAGPDVDNGKPSTDYPAPHPALPTVINCGPGPVLKTPNVVPIFFTGDDPTMVSDLTDFVNTLGATDYWKANVTEYGVGALTASAPVTIADPAMDTTDDEIQGWLADQITAGVLPAPDGLPTDTASNTIYAIFYPHGTTITEGGEQSCQAFGGYHNNIVYNGKSIAYAVLPRCDNFDGFTGRDAVTGGASHEFIEATTDPYPSNMDMPYPAFCEVDNYDIYWVLALGGGEIGDMCAQDLTNFTTFPPSPYVVQRSWSNLAALAGHDPCVPVPKGTFPYFNSAPVLPDLVKAFGGGVKGVYIPEGQSATIEVDLFSDGDTGGPWNVEAFPLHGGGGHGMGGSSVVDFEWDRTSGQNGEKLHLTITVETASTAGTELFGIHSTTNGISHDWFGAVGQTKN
jgi:hypothetical protein